MTKTIKAKYGRFTRATAKFFAKTGTARSGTETRATAASRLGASPPEAEHLTPETFFIMRSATSTKTAAAARAIAY